MSYQGDADAPSCPECASPDTERVEAGSDYEPESGTLTTTTFRCLNCGAEFSRPDRDPNES